MPSNRVQPLRREMSARSDTKVVEQGKYVSAIFFYNLFYFSIVNKLFSSRFLCCYEVYRKAGIALCAV